MANLSSLTDTFHDGTTGYVEHSLKYARKKRVKLPLTKSSKSVKSVKGLEKKTSSKFKQKPSKTGSNVVKIAQPGLEAVGKTDGMEPKTTKSKTSKSALSKTSKSTLKAVGLVVKSKSQATKSDIVTIKPPSRYVLSEVRSATKSTKGNLLDGDDSSKKGYPFEHSTVAMQKAIKINERDRRRKHMVTNEITRTQTSWLDRMAKPRPADILNTYENYGSILSLDRYERVKDTVEDAYFLTPVQAEEYFERLKREEMEKRARIMKKRNSRRKQKKLYISDKRLKALNKFIFLIKQFMIEANGTSMKIIMSEKMRAVSDQVLEDLCNVLNVQVPPRNSKDKLSQFFIRFVDWVAVWIENIAYEVKVDSLKENTNDADTVDEYQRGR